MWLLDELEKRKDSMDVAIVYRDERVSYRELWHRSEAIALYLVKNNLNRQPLVIYGNKETDIIACMHAALKVGIPYVPVDTLYPKERLLKIAAAVQADMIVNFSDIEIREYNVLRPDELYAIYRNATACEGVDKEHWVKDDDLCYILFTSGSTGEPKGVPISKGNLVNFTSWFIKYLESSLVGKCTVLNQVSYSFDVSNIMLYIYLANGKTLFSIDKKMLQNMFELFEYLRQSDLNVWVSTPSFIEICTYEKNFNLRVLPGLSQVVLAGETLQKNLVALLWERFSGVEIINGYGPTECTVLLTACVITPQMMQDDMALPIGYLLSDGRDRLENIVEVDGHDVGELAVITKSASCGYYKNVAQSNKSYWQDASGVWGYRTGDLVYKENGLLYYVGRKDSMIKLNGYRVDLNDIEVNLCRLSYISSAVVVPVKKEGVIDYLAAFLVSVGEVEENSLRFGIRVKKDLRALVPEYMVPRKIILLSELPLNTNGKVDRKKLLGEYCSDY